MAGVGITPIGASDEQAIRTVVNAYGACWNRHDMAAMGELSPKMCIGSTSSAGIGRARRLSSQATRQFIARSFEGPKLKLAISISGSSGRTLRSVSSI